MSGRAMGVTVVNAKEKGEESFITVGGGLGDGVRDRPAARAPGGVAEGPRVRVGAGRGMGGAAIVKTGAEIFPIRGDTGAAAGGMRIAVIGDVVARDRAGQGGRGDLEGGLDGGAGSMVEVARIGGVGSRRTDGCVGAVVVHRDNQIQTTGWIRYPGRARCLRRASVRHTDRAGYYGRGDRRIDLEGCCIGAGGEIDGLCIIVFGGGRRR